MSTGCHACHLRPWCATVNDIGQPATGGQCLREQWARTDAALSRCGTLSYIYEGGRSRS